MALAKVQSTGKVTGGGSPVVSITLTFAAPPTIGNGIIVLTSRQTIAAWDVNCVDNKGNTYLLAKKIGSSPTFTEIFYCPKVATTGGPFSITLTQTGGSDYQTACAIEISGVNSGGLIVDQTAGSFAASSGTTVSTGLTPANLTNAEVLLVACCSLNLTQSVINAQVDTPVWFQEYEQLSLSGNAVGEGNTRIITGAAGTKPGLFWSITTGTAYSTNLVAFAASGSPVVPGGGGVVANTMISLGLAVRLETNKVYAIPFKTIYCYPRTNIETSNDQVTWSAVTASGTKAKFLRATSGTPLISLKSCGW